MKWQMKENDSPLWMAPMCRGKGLPALIIFRVNWKGCVVLPTNHIRPREQKRGVASGANVTCGCLPEGSEGTSARRWGGGAPVTSYLG